MPMLLLRNRDSHLIPIASTKELSIVQLVSFTKQLLTTVPVVNHHYGFTTNLYIADLYQHTQTNKGFRLRISRNLYMILYNRHMLKMPVRKETNKTRNKFSIALRPKKHVWWYVQCTLRLDVFLLLSSTTYNYTLTLRQGQAFL